MLVGRPSLAPGVLRVFQSVSQLARAHPFFLFYLPGALSRQQTKCLEAMGSKFTVLPVSLALPRYSSREMFWSRKSLYAKKFRRSRLGFLDMCFWRFNMFSEPSLEGFDYLVTIDDDAAFLGNPDSMISAALQDPKWLIASAGTWNHVSERTLATRERLFPFLRDFVLRRNLQIADQSLQVALESGDEPAFHRLSWSLGNFNVYRAAGFTGPTWDAWSREINLFGGPHRFRWGDIETLGTYARLVSTNSLKDLGMVEAGVYDPKQNGVGTVRTSPTSKWPLT